jgi:CHASE3 domain sensor protein/putative methionine-R-sulfoxide reductase with GAF domain
MEDLNAPSFLFERDLIDAFVTIDTVKWPLEKKLISGFWFVFVLLVLLRLFAIKNNFSVMTASALLSRTHEINTLISDVESDILVAESSRRGYIIASDPSFLPQFIQATNDLTRNLAKLEANMRETATEKRLFEQLQRFAYKKVDSLHKSIELHKAGRDTERQIVLTGESKELFEKLEKVIQQMRAEQSNLVEQRASELQSRANRRTLYTLALSTLELVLLGLGYRFLTGYIRERKRIEQVLYEESQLRSAIINTQYEIAIAEFDVKKIFQLVVKHARDLTRADGAMIEVRQGDQLLCHAAVGNVADRIGCVKPKKGTLAGTILQDGQTFRSGDIGRDLRTQGDTLEIKEGSVIVTSLFRGKESTGVLEVFAHRVKAFSERDVQTLEFLAGLMATAMVNAEKHDSTKLAVPEHSV